MAEEQKTKRKEEKNLLEYLVFFCSVGLILALLTYLTYTTITESKTAPLLEVSFVPYPQGNLPYLQKVNVKNTGNVTAEDVIIEMVLQKDGEKIESSQVEIMFVSGQTSVEAWVNFTHDPESADTLFARIVSYKSS